MRQLVAVLPSCSDAERAILLALPDVCVAPTPLYSVALARAVKGRELAAEGTIQILRGMADDTDADDDVRALSYALARELGSIIKIVDAVEVDPDALGTPTARWSVPALGCPIAPGESAIGSL